MALRATLYKKPFQLCERTAVYKMIQISPHHGLSWKMGQVYVGYSAFYSSIVSVIWVYAKLGNCLPNEITAFSMTQCFFYMLS